MDLDVHLSAYQSVYISKIVVPKEKRNEGMGTEFMRKMAELADEYGVYLTLSPSNSFGGSESRLKKFYKRFGFRLNKGRKADHRFMYAMVRDPAHKLREHEEIRALFLYSNTW